MQDHYAGFVMGILLSVFALSGAIAGIILGYLNDIGVSLKRLVLFGIMFKIIGNLLYFIGINIYIVVISRLIAGIGMGLVVRLLFSNRNDYSLSILSHLY
jgi:predicted MFS family arabinose efflux permease